MENKVKDGNYIMIQSFMVKDLKLKGNELLVYAIIYGFSQEENCVFSGSLQYLADWTNSTKQGIMKCLKSLEEKELIVKQSLMVNKVVYLTKFNASGKQSLIDSGKQSLTNNIDNKDNNKDNIIYIVEYLNEKAKTNYKHSTSKTQTLIKARLKDGFSVDDFKSVIDKKCKEWIGTEWERYLRPETLFGNKFENYLNARETTPKKELSQQRDYDKEYLNSLYDNIDDIKL